MHISHIHTFTRPHILACTHAYMHTCTHAHMHTCTHAHMHIFTHSHIHIFTHSHIYTFTHAHIHTFTHLHIHTFIHIHTFTHSHIHTSTHSHIYTFTHLSCSETMRNHFISSTTQGIKQSCMDTAELTATRPQLLQQRDYGSAQSHHDSDAEMPRGAHYIPMTDTTQARRVCVDPEVT